MSVPALLESARGAAEARVWSAAVELARLGAVQGISDDGEEVLLHVRTRQRPRPFEVYLWPDEGDWGCDCGMPEPCVHICAATIAMSRTRSEGEALPTPSVQVAVTVRYRFTSQKSSLAVARSVVSRDGRERPLDGAIGQTDYLVRPADLHAEALLVTQPPGVLSSGALRRLLALLGRDADAMLDGEPVRLSADDVSFVVRVQDDGEGFKVGLFRPPGLDRLFRGAALADGVLRPTSHGDLTTEQRRLLVDGVHFRADEVGQLVQTYLPNLRGRVPVEIDTTRLPDEHALEPRVRIRIAERLDGLEVKTDLVYGTPPVAWVEGGALRVQGGVVPARDPGKERAVARIFEATAGWPVGFAKILPPDRAAAFLTDVVAHHDGPVEGRADPDRFRVVERAVVPRLQVGKSDDGWKLDVSFAVGDGDHQADPRAVLGAWRSGRSLVPLLDGGFAELPDDWLREHGPLLQELLDARDERGVVSRNATAALVELLEDTAAEVPPDLTALRTFLEGGGGLPEVAPPPGFAADLRPYQVAGLQWLRFLRDTELHGVLADDMGLGKTVQALAALADAGGRSLVIAPTSVIANWEREAHRFAPTLRVNRYHGVDRELDEDADVTLTSYALLRRDIAALQRIEWSYVVLDEAQAIKNADSQTARAAFGLRARHRLALTGTPIENRLDELWSLFRFLMPGLLGPRTSFRDRFARPIETGDARAAELLRRRVRPYVLRRLKQQVATELPPLTDMVIRCEMGDGQRKIYDTVRLAMRADVQAAIAERGEKGATLQVLEALLRMRQACCDPALLPGDFGGDGIDACKLDELEEILVEIVSEGHKALVFSQWTGLLDRVEPRLRELGVDWVRLDGSTRERQSVIDRFQADDGPPVFLLSLKAGGTGINLTAADYVIHLDPWWNPAVQQQATDRAHRIGQDKPVVSLRLVAAGTVEERILELQDAKQALAVAALGGDGGFVRALDLDDLKSLFEAA